MLIYFLGLSDDARDTNHQRFSCVPVLSLNLELQVCLFKECLSDRTGPDASLKPLPAPTSETNFNLKNMRKLTIVAGGCKQRAQKNVVFCSWSNFFFRLVKHGKAPSRTAQIDTQTQHEALKAKKKKKSQLFFFFSLAKQL